MLAAAAASASAVCAAAVPSLSGPSGLGPAPASFDLVSRVYVPYGLSATDLAFGMGAAEQIIYDAMERYAYAVSEQGVLNVVDYADAAAPVVVTSLAVDLRGAVATDVEICPERGLLLVSVSGEVLNKAARVGRRTDAGRVLAFESVRRSSPRTPKPLWQVQVGALPDMISPNRDCSLLAVANEGEGVYGGVHSSTGTGGVATGGGLVDPDGSVSLIHLPKQGPPTVSEVRLDALAPSDEHLIGLGVHLPLPLGAMEHFDLHSARHNTSLDLGSARRAYSPVSQLEPEYLAWSADGSKVFVNLQENAAIVTVDVATATAERITPLGLTDWSAAGGTDGIDIVDDGACRLQHYEGLFSINSADTIGSFEVDGEMYVMAAMEGDRVRYGDFKEDQKLRSVVASNASFGKDFAAFRAPDGALQQVFDTFGESKLRVSIGSSGVDYSDPTSPRLERVVAFGARGVSIYRARDMALVWSSGSLLEREGCAAFPWAHNGEQDEEYAAVHGVLYNATSDEGLREDIEDKSNPKKEGCDDGGDGRPGACPLGETVDRRSTKDGASAEALALGVACGRMIAVTATEKGGIAFVFDVSDPGSPVLLFTHHLSPASRHANPTVAYAYGYLGDIDSETILFLDASHSPTGAAAVIFAGAWSGTISLYDLRMADGSRCTSLVGPTAQGDARGDGSLGAVGKPSPHPSPTAAPVPAPPVVAAPPTSSPGIEALFAFGAAAVILLVCAAYGCGTFLGLGCLPQSRAWTRMEEPVHPEILQPATAK